MGFFKAFALNGVLIAIIAHGLVGISLIWDKVLLQRKGMQSLPSYVFWLGAISIFGLILIPFGFHLPPWKIAALAFVAGFCDLLATWFYYAALKAGEASEELAAMGGFTPLATVLLSIPLLGVHLHGGQFIGFIVMTLGGFVMFFAEKLPLTRMLPLIVAASLLFGLTDVLQKLAFNATNFVSGYVFFTIGTFIGAMALLLRPSWRRQIFKNSEEAPPRSKAGYMINRFVAGVGSFLVVFAVSRTSPSMVEAISGVRYVIIFVLAWAITMWRPSWFRESFNRRALLIKALGTALVVAGLILAGLQGSSVGSGGPS
ncbi:MAG TPA: EamA family transporter [Acidobacteriaceae bacterium]|jgi:drug/metabolite transporter (DMT)-like permease|nr:EamA family transporter [Acidobacteriaceae bacterium]